MYFFLSDGVFNGLLYFFNIYDVMLKRRRRVISSRQNMKSGEKDQLQKKHLVMISHNSLSDQSDTFDSHP